jgi:hypothetical protein
MKECCGVHRGSESDQVFLEALDRRIIDECNYGGIAVVRLDLHIGPY